MKKLVLSFAIIGTVLAVISCNNDAPKSDLNAQEQAAVDSAIVNNEAASDSLEATMKALIGEDSTEQAEEATHHHDEHDGHNH